MTELELNIVTKELFLHISKLPQDIKKCIGEFSNAVINQQRLIKVEFYNNWIKDNKVHIVQIIKTWTKKDMAFVLDNIKSIHNAYYNNCKVGSMLYKKSVDIMLRARIEILIDIIGRKSNIEMYSLLLAIKKYDAKKHNRLIID